MKNEYTFLLNLISFQLKYIKISKLCLNQKTLSNKLFSFIQSNRFSNCIKQIIFFTNFALEFGYNRVIKNFFLKNKP